MKSAHIAMLALLPVCLGMPLCAETTQDAEAAARRLFVHFQTATPAPDVLPSHDPATATRVAAAYVELLEQAHPGARAGYKAGLTSRAAQQRFSVDHPVLGILFTGMLRPSPATIDPNSGARLLIEADLLVRVGDAAINTAQDDPALLAALEAVIPFVEVPDLLFAPAVTIDAALLQAANVGARWGVLGAPIPLQPTAEWIQRLARFQVRMSGSGDTPTSSRGAELLGHPLAVVAWLRDAVLARGERLRPGDLLSLGSLSPLRPVQPGTVRAVYEGLDPTGPVEVVVHFAAR